MIWTWSQLYKDHIVLIGQFHTSMNYIGMLCGHKMLGSGYAEILIEANLVTSGCLHSVLNGKAYAKSLFALKTVTEALERLLVTYPDEAFFIQDGNALSHALKDLPPTLGGICMKLRDQLVHKKNFFFSTDSYVDKSIKAQERVRRCTSETFLVDGPAIRKHADLKVFLQNDDNKKQLCSLLLRVWSSDQAVDRIKSCTCPIIVVEGKAYILTVSDDHIDPVEIPELYSTQEETDTRVILYLKYAVKRGFKSAVVRSPDTDILVILLHYAHAINIKIYLDSGVGW